MKKPLEKEEIEGYNIYKLLRIARNIPAKKLSEDLGVSPAYIHAIENGDRQPSEELKKNYLKALKVDEEVIDKFSKRSKDYSSFEKMLFGLLKLIIKSDPEL